MGGFHHVLRLQKTIYKRYVCLGLDKWITGAGTTKSSSTAEKVAHGLHYNTSIHIVQMQMESITNMYLNIDEELLNKLIKLRVSLCLKNGITDDGNDA